MSKPSEEKKNTWLIEESDKILVKFFDLDSIGKWMLFYSLEEIDDAWALAKELYHKEELDGVYSIKVSTNSDESEMNYNDICVIFFMCTESYDEDHILKIGKNILKKMKHTPLNSNYIYYKTNTQTTIGNRIKGEKKNFFYRIEV